MEKITEDGKIVLKWGNKKGEVFLLREKKYMESGLHNVEISVTVLKGAKEKRIGFVHGRTKKASRTFVVTNVAVHPKYEKRNIATSLISYLRTKHPRIEGMADWESIDFYKKMGSKRAPNKYQNDLIIEAKQKKKKFHIK
jgi:ribosomal protein S18 acetylase RimI-like enzyme